MTDDDLAAARARIADRSRQVGEFATTRPTPTRDEQKPGEIVMLKQWDLSPVDPSSFDPTEPPGRPLPTEPPVPIAAPVASGTAVVGSVLTTTDGEWRNSPTSFAYQWRRGATNIGAATGPSYTLVAADDLAVITCMVTAINGVGSVGTPSNDIGPVVRPPPANTVAPVASGTPEVGETLTTTNGTWTNAPTFTYLWRRGGTPIVGGATAQAYVLVAADLGAMITCAVTGTNSGGNAQAISNAIGPIVEPEE
jgi:hypothetical protein